MDLHLQDLSSQRPILENCSYILINMQRARNMKKWKVDSYNYESPEHFLSHPRIGGAHSIQYQGSRLDILVEDRRATATLVVFAGAVSLNLKTVPAFFGLSLAEDTGVNLIAVADPSLENGEITVAWYLGGSQTGPLRKVLSSLIGHVAESLGGSRLILFGSSGGGYAAAHLAHDFPGCMALVWNPRLSLERWSEKPLRLYFKNCLNHSSDGKLTKKDRDVLAPFGPTEISALRSGPLDHDLLIYHNLLDPQFLNLQLFPFLDATPADPRLNLQFSLDKLGHGGAPADQVRRILSRLAQGIDRHSAITSAGFMPREEATDSALRQYPDVALRMQQNEKAYEEIQLKFVESERLRAEDVSKVESAISLHLAAQERAEIAESQCNSLEIAIAQLEITVERQSAEIGSLTESRSLKSRVIKHPASRKLVKLIPLRLKAAVLRRLR